MSTRKATGPAAFLALGVLVIGLVVLVAADPSIRDELVSAINGEGDANVSLSLVGASPTPDHYKLAVNKAGTGNGKVNIWFTSDTQAQLFGTCAANESTCTMFIYASQYQGYKLSAQAIAATGHAFTGWTGAAGCGADPKCSLAFPFSSSTATITAGFAAPSPSPTPTPAASARLTATPTPTPTRSTPTPTPTR